ALSGKPPASPVPFRPPKRAHASHSSPGWDFSRVPVSGRDATPEDEPKQTPDELPQMDEDQDALTADVFKRRPSGRGIDIQVSGGIPGGTKESPDGVRWIQTVNTNAPLGGATPPFVDHTVPAGTKPFYFRDGRERATFLDTPARTKNDVWWEGTLSLVGVRGRTITRIDSMQYGFAIDAKGTLTLNAPHATTTGDIVVHGDTLRSEHPDWVFSGGFAVPQVPGESPDSPERSA